MKQSIREELDRKQAEMEEEKNVKEQPQEAQTGDPELKSLVQLLLDDKAREIKERNKKEDKERQETIAKLQQGIDNAKQMNERNKMRRDLCDGMGGPAHQSVNPANGNKRSAWRGQVNSDGTFSPVCCKCLMVMPKIKATAEQQKEGLGLSFYQQMTVEALERWHQSSYAGGCDNHNCYLCHPVKAEVPELVAV